MHPSQALSPCRTAYVRSLALTACLLVGLAEAVRASGPTGATLYVDAGATGANDGSSWCDAYRNPQDALTAAVASDTILVADGTYMPDGGYVPVGGTHVPGNADRTATFQLVTGVTLEGGYAGCGAEDPDQRDVDAFETILSGDLNGNDDGFTNNGENSYHVVTGSGTDNTAILHGFTITAGNADGVFPNSLGGGMYNSGGSPTVTNCTFSGNSAGSAGGGMLNVDSRPAVTNCTFSGNAAGFGGGGMSNSNSSPVVNNCTFSGNAAFDSGGGMYNSLSNPTVTDCMFSGNSAYAAGHLGGGGGAMFNSGGSPTLTNCTFSDNSANYTAFGDGGGMYNWGGSPVVVNCTFSGNSAGDTGGGMYNTLASNPLVTNCMFSANSAGSNGGGIINFIASSPTVTNCTFSANSAGCNGGGMYNSNSSSPAVTNCTFSGNSASSNGGGMYNGNSSPAVTNCVLWGNVDDADGNNGGPFMDESAQIHTASGNPTVNYSIVQGGWSGTGGVGVADSNPLFADPDGPDNVPGTEDDDLRLMLGSPAIDAGSNDAVLPDVADLDGDNDTDEPTPLDLDGNPRFVDNPGSPDCPHGGDCGTPPIVDMGPYEFACLFTGDSDGNGDIDLFDYQAYLDCAGGPGLPPPPEGDPPTSECDVFDANCDGDIDLFDWGALQLAFTGP